MLKKVINLWQKPRLRIVTVVEQTFELWVSWQPWLTEKQDVSTARTTTGTTSSSGRPFSRKKILPGPRNPNMATICAFVCRKSWALWSLLQRWETADLDGTWSRWWQEIHGSSVAERCRPALPPRSSSHRRTGCTRPSFLFGSMEEKISCGCHSAHG